MHTGRAHVVHYMGLPHHIVFQGEQAPQSFVREVKVGDPEAAARFLRHLSVGLPFWRRHLPAHIFRDASQRTRGNDELQLLTHAVAPYIARGRVRFYHVAPLEAQGHGIRGPKHTTFRFVRASKNELDNHNFPRVPTPTVAEAEALVASLAGDDNTWKKVLTQADLNVDKASSTPGDGSVKKQVVDALVKGDLAVYETPASQSPKKTPGFVEQLLEPATGPGNRPVPLAPEPTIKEILTDSAKAAEAVQCALTAFSLKCSHGSRGYQLDVISDADNLNGAKGIQVISPPEIKQTGLTQSHRESVTINFSGSCANGKDNCPAITISGEHGSTTESKGPIEFQVSSPQQGRKIDGFMDFLRYAFIPDMGGLKYNTYNVESSGCADVENHSATIHVFPTLKWNGSVEAGYSYPDGSSAKSESNLQDKAEWSIKAGIKGNIGENSWDFSHSTSGAANDYFPKAKKFISSLVDSMDQVAESKSKDFVEKHGLSTHKDDDKDGLFKFNVTWPTFSLGGGIELQEVKSSNHVDLGGEVALKLSPLKLEVETDIIDWLCIIAGPHGKLIQKIRKAAKEGVGTEKVNAQAVVEALIKITGSIEGEFKWQKSANEKWLSTAGDKSAGAALGITIGLAAKAEARTRVFMVKVVAGVAIAVQGASNSGEGIGVIFSLLATTAEDKPALGGSVKFTGLAVYYTYYAEVSKNERESEALKDESIGRGDDYDDASEDSPDSSPLAKESKEKKVVIMDAAEWPKSNKSDSGTKPTVVLRDVDL